MSLPLTSNSKPVDTPRKIKATRIGTNESKKKGGYLFNFMVHLNLHLAQDKPFNEAASWLMKGKSCVPTKMKLAGLQVVLCSYLDPVYPSYSKKPSWFVNPSSFYFSDDRVLMTEKTFDYLLEYKTIAALYTIRKDYPQQRL